MTWAEGRGQKNLCFSRPNGPQPGHCNAQWNGTGTASGNYISGTFSGSDCTLTISNASFPESGELAFL